MTEKGYPPSDINPPGTSETGAYPHPYSGSSTAGYSEQPAGQAYPSQPYSDQEGYQPMPAYLNQQYAPQPPAYGTDGKNGNHVLFGDVISVCIETILFERKMIN